MSESWSAYVGPGYLRMYSFAFVSADRSTFSLLRSKVGSWLPQSLSAPLRKSLVGAPRPTTVLQYVFHLWSMSVLLVKHKSVSMIMYVCTELLEKAMESTYLHVINVFEYLFNDLAHRRYCII